MWEGIYYVALMIVVALTAYMVSRSQKQQNMKPGGFDTTSADEGGSIPVIFGTCDVSPNVTAFQAGIPQAIKK